MQAFAESYNSCNPALFTSPDQPYILAFSIIMLHTDAFNKSNKKKMTRADYVKNTRIDGISTILLEVGNDHLQEDSKLIHTFSLQYIYDNITYAPFMYADDRADPLGKRSAETHTPNSTVGNPASKERNKIEVYRCIAGEQLSRLRIDMGLLVPIKSRSAIDLLRINKLTRLPRSLLIHWDSCILRLFDIAQCRRIRSHDYSSACRKRCASASSCYIRVGKCSTSRPSWGT